MKFSEQVKNFNEKTDLLTNQVFKGSSKQVSMDIAEGSPVSTGALLGSWAPSNGSLSSYKFQGGESAWKKTASGYVKNTGIAAQNRATAMADLKPRISSVTSGLKKSDLYYFTNDVSYIHNAEHEGWQGTKAYHMRENAVLNWQLIVNEEIAKLKT